MHSLQKQFHDFLEKEELLNADDQMLLAVSGGLDSMVLADVFFKSNFKFSVAHCNFGLRDAESDGDELLVKNWCKENKVTFHRKKIELGAGSIQLNARNTRYEWFNELCEAHGYSKLATAHHLNDSIETLLLNLTRGTGLKGVVGIKPKSDKTIRPLLFATKDELKTYALASSLEWREDSSNNKADYDRNAIRLGVIPKLEELNPSLISTFSDTSERLRLTVEILEREVEAIKGNYLRADKSRFELDVSWISNKSDLLILSEILSEFGFNYATVKEIHSALGRAGRMFLSSSFQLSVDRTSIFIQSISAKPKTELIIDGEGEYSLGERRLVLSGIEKSAVNFSRQSSVVYFDADKINFPLEIRAWQQGDRFRPLGMKGSKNVSDFLIDKKVPLALKDEVLVLISGDEIAWLMGHQISEKFKITDETNRILRVELVAS